VGCERAGLVRVVFVANRAPNCRPPESNALNISRRRACHPFELGPPTRLMLASCKSGPKLRARSLLSSSLATLHRLLEPNWNLSERLRPS